MKNTSKSKELDILLGLKGRKRDLVVFLLTPGILFTLMMPMFILSILFETAGFALWELILFFICAVSSTFFIILLMGNIADMRRAINKLNGFKKQNEQTKRKA